MKHSMPWLMAVMLLGGCYKSVSSKEDDTDTCLDGDTSSGPAGIVWITICGGSFQMGSNKGESNERPVHDVSMPSFNMTKTEVTVSQYEECLTAGQCSEPKKEGPFDNWAIPGYANHPVNNVDWNQATAFCLWAGGRLPSEAEWEYAARSGGKEKTYPWGDEQATCGLVVMDYGGDGCGTSRAMEVCSKPNGNTRQGVCDMAGNVYEWVEDLYHESYSEAPTDGSAWTVGSDERRILRGGSWDVDESDFFRTSKRSRFNPTFRDTFNGFRCARSSQ